MAAADAGADGADGADDGHQTTQDDDADADGVDTRLAALRQVFDSVEEDVRATTADALDDYKVRTTGCITPTDRTALDALGFKREHTHAHTTEVDGETEAEIVLYLTDTRRADQ